LLESLKNFSAFRLETFVARQRRSLMPLQGTMQPVAITAPNEHTGCLLEQLRFPPRDLRGVNSELFG